MLVLSMALASVAGSAPSPTPGLSFDRLIDFEQYRFGVPPLEFDYKASAPIEANAVPSRPTWRTYVDLSAPSPKMVLIQSSAVAQAEQDPIAVLRDVTLENVNLAVSFRFLGGDRARSAGLLWRAQGMNSYRSVLVSALDREVRLLKVDHGRAIQLASAAATFDESGWNVLEVSVQGEQVDVWLNDRRALEARAPEPVKPGGVGLVTAGDTVALFDDFHVQNGQTRIVRKPRPVPALSAAPVLYVAEIQTTQADFKTPCLSFRPGGQIRWRAQVVDEYAKLRPGVIVECELVSSAGNVLDRDKAMTGTDGAALFTRNLATNASPGAYSVRISGLTHADKLEVAYSSRANLKSAASFEVRP